MLAVITCHFNFCGYNKPKASLLRFLRQMSTAGIPVYGAEAFLDKPATSGIHGWTQIKAHEANILWQKERLLNLAERLVPAEFDKIAWIDPDVWFDNPRWHEQCDKMLDSFNVVQPFSFASWTGPDGAVCMRKPSMLAHGRPDPMTSHAGLAMAARRGLWKEARGLYELCVAGSGDVAMACAFLGSKLPLDHMKILGGGPSSRALYSQWADLASKWAGGKTAACPGSVIHEWHGPRNHASKHDCIRELDAARHLGFTASKLLGFTASAPQELKQGVAKLFEDRAEDGSPAKILVKSPSERVAVVVTCHEAYLPMLGQCLASIDRQMPCEKILVLDNVSQPFSREGWLVLRTASDGSPNPARNAGLARASSNWVIFWDADNIMPAGYVESMSCDASAASRGAAAIYPSIEYVSEDGQRERILEVPEYDYWLLRRKPFVDTSSCWRADAVRGAGGFSERQPKYDDYELALRLTRLGWGLEKASTKSRITNHTGSRGKQGHVDAAWNAWTFGILTMWGPVTPATDDVLSWYASADLPPNCRVWWSADHSDTRLMRSLSGCRVVLEAGHVPVTIMDSGRPWQPTELGSRDFGRHLHVASLYNKIVPRIDDDMVMFVEDDTVGPLDGIKRLLERIRPGGDVVTAGARYRSRSSPASCCASSDPSRWASIPYDIQADTDCGMIGGGFTLHSNWMLKKCLPLRCTASPNLMGWDANLGSSIRANGGRIIIRPGVDADHKCAEVLEHQKA